MASADEVSSERYQRFPDIASCYAALYPRARALYVSPDVATSAANNPYLHNLYVSLAQSRMGSPVSAGRWQAAPLAGRLRGEVPIWHQHWLQCSSLPTALRACLRVAMTALYRVSGGHVLWTVHNLEPHVRKYRWLNARLTRAMLALAERLHVHTASAADEVCRQWRVDPRKIVLVPHPPYAVRQIPRAEARAQLAAHYGLSLGTAQVVLMFGMIARYKQVVEVLEAFEGLDPSSVQLVIAGALRGNEASYQQEIEAALARTRAPATLCIRFIPEADVALFFSAADVVLFNYRQILTSGATQLARDYEKPIWIPNLLALADLDGPDIMRFRDASALREAALDLAGIAPADRAL